MDLNSLGTPTLNSAKFDRSMQHGDLSKSVTLVSGVAPLKVNRGLLSKIRVAKFLQNVSTDLHQILQLYAAF